ncbi:hypothetical protein QTP88_000296 [Uroleucon formosanum]
MSMTVFLENVNTVQFSSRSNRTRSRIEKSERRIGGDQCRPLYRVGGFPPSIMRTRRVPCTRSRRIQQRGNAVTVSVGNRRTALEDYSERVLQRKPAFEVPTMFVGEKLFVRSADDSCDREYGRYQALL